MLNQHTTKSQSEQNYKTVTTHKISLESWISFGSLDPISLAHAPKLQYQKIGILLLYLMEAKNHDNAYSIKYTKAREANTVLE